ncbi:MAG: YhdP family protein [Candidatus Reddybacter sp.]
MDVPAVLKRSARYAWSALAFLIISYALLVIIGRQLLPSLEQHQELIGQILSERLGVQIATEHMGGSWTRLTPRLQAQSLSITSQGDAPAITISSVQSDVDILRSILNGEIIWNDLSIGEVKLTLLENAEGKWFVSNFPISGLDDETNNRGQMDVLTNIILLSTHIGIEQVAVDVAFYDGTTTTLYIDDVQIESNGNFHRARARLSLDQAEDKAELLVEGRGDPNNWENFDGKAYINFSRVNLRNALGIILRGWLPLSPLSSTADSNTLLDAELWIASLKPGHFDLRGKVKAEEIPLNWDAELPPIKNLDTTLTGWFTSGTNWGLQCQNLRFDWGKLVIKPLNMSFQQGLGEDWHKISLAADHINLSTLKHSLVQTQLGGEATAALIKTLNPSGRLQGIKLTLDLKKARPLTQFGAHIEQLSLDAWHSTPAVRGLSGYFQWQDDQGYFDLDTGDNFAMRYPGVYTDFMHYGPTRGRVNIAWTSDDSSLQIAGGPIDIRGKEGEIRAYISLDIPTKNKGREPEMFLQAGIKNSHSRYRNNYLPAILNPTLLDWLERSIGDTDITEAGFIWRGSLKGESPQKRSIQFYSQLTNGELNYDPGWPKLSDLSAQITIDDTLFKGIVNSAKIGAGPELAQLDKALIATLPGDLLSVQANITSPLNTAVNSLLNSPLANRMATLRSWEIQGDASARLDLVIPLSTNRQGESYRVEADIRQGRMQLRDFQPVAFSKLEGTIAYNDNDGLYSPGVTGSLWGQTLKATIATQGNKLKIDAAGLLDLSLAPSWQPLFTENITGTAAYTASFVSPDNDSAPTLTLRSDLQGIAIALPAPLNKPAGDTRPLRAALQFRESDLLIDARTDKLKAQLSIANQQLASGSIHIGDKSILEDTKNNGEHNLPEHKGLLVTGHTPVFQLDEWLEVLLRNSSSAKGENRPGFDTRAMVEIDRFSAAGFTLDDVTVDTLHSKQLWDIDIESPTLAGNIRVPEDRDQAIVARLNYLTLPKPELDSEQSFLGDLDPSTLPTLDFVTEGLRIGDDELGSLAFVMRANEQGVRIDQIEAEITGITIDNTPDGDAAQLIWTKINGEHRSGFTGALLSDDLGGVLKAWDMPMILTTNRAAFLTDLSWQGKPWDLSTQALRGNIALRFEKGRFFQAPGTTTNALLKVIGLINFDTWLRRLKFDFSDLFSTGVHFDNVEGGLAFEEHQMRFDEPIVVTLPSGKLRLLGQTNLAEETIDARLIATLPVGTNLPWIVALAGGLPAAAGVYITSKLFEKQVDRISSIGYKITGDLDNPEVKVDRIFSDKTE